MKLILFSIVLMFTHIGVESCTNDTDCSPTGCCRPSLTGDRICIKYLGFGQFCSIDHTSESPVILIITIDFIFTKIYLSILLQYCGCKPGLHCMTVLSDEEIGHRCDFAF